MRNQNSPIAVEGYPFIVLAGAVTLVLAAVRWQLALIAAAPLYTSLVAILACLAFAATLFIMYFFRNPERIPPADEKSVLAPADGVVIYLGNAPEGRTGMEMRKISIFMSVFNVHVNRVPFSGRVLDTFRVEGKFLDARDQRATFENEQSGIVLETEKGSKMVFVQVAGLIARRIVSYPVTGDVLVRGERYGLIRFGSRVDLYLPLDADLRVTMGDRTVAGETIVGYLP
jgi:phosphatidylserine decarboxylase